MLIGGQMRYFGAAPEPPKPGPKSGRTTFNPGYYNKRFEPSKSLDGNYIDTAAGANFRAADGFEPRQTERDPSKFNYSNNIFRNDINEWTTRAGDYFWQIGCRLHRSNDGWTRCLIGYTAFCFMMIPQAFMWKIHFAFFSMATYARIRDKGAEPTVDEIHILDTIFKNEKLSELFSPNTYHVIDYDQEFDTGRSEKFPEYHTTAAKFFNADSNSTWGMYKIGDVESGATMTINFKTMPYSNNKYNFSEPFLIYDMSAEVTHEGNTFTEHIIKEADTLKTKSVFVPWH